MPWIIVMHGFRWLIAPAFAAVVVAGCERAEVPPTPAPSASATVRPLATAPSSLRKELAIAYETMARGKSFGGTAVGYYGVPSSETEAFRALLREDEAAALFDRAVDEGTSAGRLYGLAGLYLVDRDRCELRAAPLRESDEVVRLWMSGCMGGSLKRLGDVVSHPGAAVWEGPEDSLWAWERRNPGEESEIDIDGGFLPSMLAGRL